MNCLNSILLEGSCALEPRAVTTPDGQMCEFSITSYRYKPDGMKEESTFEVEAGGRLGETIAHTLKQGVGLRIVGRIREARSGFKIVAEHVEIKRGFTVL